MTVVFHRTSAGFHGMSVVFHGTSAGFHGTSAGFHGMSVVFHGTFADIRSGIEPQPIKEEHLARTRKRRAVV
jgi:hypothetical protein